MGDFLECPQSLGSASERVAYGNQRGILEACRSEIHFYRFEFSRPGHWSNNFSVMVPARGESQVRVPLPPAPPRTAPHRVQRHVRRDENDHSNYHQRNDRKRSTLEIIRGATVTCQNNRRTGVVWSDKLLKCGRTDGRTTTLDARIGDANTQTHGKICLFVVSVKFVSAVGCRRDVIAVSAAAKSALESSLRNRLRSSFSNDRIRTAGNHRKYDHMCGVSVRVRVVSERNR